MSHFRNFVSGFLLICLFLEANASFLSFVKVKGDIIVREDGTRLPKRGSIMKCMGKCRRTERCNCIRMLTDGSDHCETFTTKTQSNSLNDTGFVYFSWDKRESFNDTSIALKKVAMQSSDLEVNGVIYSADRAVDGKRNAELFEAPYISHTNDNPADVYPWWQVDLRAEYVVTGVAILNRKKMSERLHDFQVRVGNIQLTHSYNDVVFDKNPLCGEHKGGGIGSNETKIITCSPCPVQGRFVSIQIVRNCTTCSQPKSNILNMAEVDVYGFLPS